MAFLRMASRAPSRSSVSLAMMGSYAGAFLAGDPARLDAVNIAAADREDVRARRLSAVISR